MYESDSDDPSLPLPYKLVIALSVLLLSALGFLAFSQMHRNVETSFQVYGSPRLLSGAPAVVRLVQFDAAGRENVPALITGVAIRTRDSLVLLKGVGPSVPTLPADFRIESVDAGPGEAVLQITAIGWDNPVRIVEAPVQVAVAALPDLEAGLEIQKPLQAPLDQGAIRLEMILSGGGLTDSVPSRAWVRVLDKSGKPLDAAVHFAISKGPLSNVGRTGRLGIVPIDLLIGAPNDTVQIGAEAGTESVIWREMIAPDRFALVTASPPVLALAGSDSVPIKATGLHVSGTPGFGEVYCNLFRHGALSQTFRVPAGDEPVRTSLPLARDGLYWVTCGDTYLSTSEFPAYTALVKPNTLATFESIRDVVSKRDPLVAAWPPLPDMTSAERESAAAYLLDALKPPRLEIAQLANTQDGDNAALDRGMQVRRNTLFALVGVVGFGVLLWATAVIVRSKVGAQRLLPAILIVVAGVANLVGLFYLLSLTFG